MITTPFTFASTTHAIVRNGLVPVFCDIREDDYTMDTSKIEELITDQTVAIVPVHVYGNVCDVEAIDLIAKKAIKRKTGARALRSIVEELMLDIMYDIPTSHDITKFVVTKDMVEKQDEIDNTAELIHLPQSNASSNSEKTRAEIA